ncbi:nucleotidyl transferase AbiEii/AbiGii toxin family protein [Thiothrix fructosivorans]|nr:nucleotidyl transferase AbiEii/AbiGii toxin family protein [Thiothrix fructosivorans]
MHPTFSEQVRLLVTAMPYVAQETCFALKGGSAINLFLRNLPRLSVDLDLVYLPIEDRETSLTNIDAAMRRIAARIRQAMVGSSVAETLLPKTKQCIRLQVMQHNTSIKIEVSPVMRGTLNPISASVLSAATQVEFGFARMNLLHFTDIYAGKLCAALDRQHPRDLFDVHFLLENEGITPALKDTFLVYLISSNRPMAELLAPNRHDIKALYAAEFVGMTNEHVPLEQLLDARERMIATLHERLTDRDREFLLSVKRGKPEWSLCALPNAANLPAVRWKLHNLAAMKLAQHKQALAKLEQVLL